VKQVFVATTRFAVRVYGMKSALIWQMLEIVLTIVRQGVHKCVRPAGIFCQKACLFISLWGNMNSIAGIAIYLEAATCSKCEHQINA